METKAFCLKGKKKELMKEIERALNEINSPEEKSAILNVIKTIDKRDNKRSYILIKDSTKAWDVVEKAFKRCSEVKPISEIVGTSVSIIGMKS